MNRYLLLITMLMLSKAASAQTENTGPQVANQSFTLEQCISYALENNVSLKNAVLDQEIADGRVKETRGIGLPQIDASVSVLHNQKLPRFFGPNVDTSLHKGAFSFFQNIEGARDGDIVAGRNFFQLPSSGDAKLSITQIIFNSSYLVGLQAANAYRDLAVKSKDQSKEQLIQNVSKAYYSCLINKDRVGLFDANIARVDSLLKTTSALFDNGFAESIDVDRIKVTLNNLKVEQSKFLRLQELSIQLLKFQMNYPMEQPLDIQGDLSTLKVDTSVLNEYSLNWDYAARTDYRLLEANRKLQALNLKNKYSEGLPSLVAFANLGYSTQSTNIGGIFKTNTDIKDNGAIGPDKWYSYSSFGVSLNVPLFSGLQRNYRIQQAKLELQKTDNTFRSLRSGIDLEIKQVAAAYLSAAESVEAQKQNTALAENIARVTRIKYEQGVGSNLEVVEAESALREAQINYFNSLYDAIVAKIDLDKAYGKLTNQSIPNK
jgi:outer membrane protein